MDAIRRPWPAGEQRFGAWAAAIAAALAAAALLARLPLPIAAASGLAVVGLAAAGAWPFAGLMLFVALVYVRPEDTFSDLVGVRLVLGIGVGVFGIWVLRSISARSAPEWSATTAWAVAFVLCAFLSSLLQAPASLVANVSDLARFLILLFLVSQLVRSPRQAGAFATLLVLASAWLAVVALVNYYAGHGFLSPQGFRARGTGAFVDPNDTALALVPAVPLALVGLTGGKGQRALRLGSAVCVALMVWAIYLTNSRGGMLALGGAVCFWVALRYGWRGAALGAIIAVGAVLLGPSRMAGLTTGDDSAAGRIAAWGAGLRMLVSHPLLGVGMGRFTDFNDVNDLTAHNSFVLAFAELGLLGALCWVGMFSSALRALWRSAFAVRRSESISKSKSISISTRPQSGRWYRVTRQPFRLRFRSESRTQNAALPAALIASLGGYLIAAMFLSKTFFEIPFIYLGLAAAVSAARPGRTVDAGPRGAAERVAARPTIAAELSVAVLLTLGGILAVALVAWRFGGA